MAVVDRTTLINYFKRGLKPLENHFANLIDSCWHKNDTINISNVSGLQTALDNAGGGANGSTISMVDGSTLVVNSNEMLRFMLVRTSGTQVIKCGTSAGGSQIFNVEVSNTGVGYLHEEVFAPATTLTLHFTSAGAFTLLIQKITFS